jgi:hypothetical protein
MMSRVLRVPDEKFRDKVHKTMYENLTTFCVRPGKSRQCRPGRRPGQALRPLTGRADAQGT